MTFGFYATGTQAPTVLTPGGCGDHLDFYHTSPDWGIPCFKEALGIPNESLSLLMLLSFQSGIPLSSDILDWVRGDV